MPLPLQQVRPMAMQPTGTLRFMCREKFSATDAARVLTHIALPCVYFIVDALCRAHHEIGDALYLKRACRYEVSSYNASFSTARHSSGLALCLNIFLRMGNSALLLYKISSLVRRLTRILDVYFRTLQVRKIHAANPTLGAEKASQSRVLRLFSTKFTHVLFVFHALERTLDRLPSPRQDIKKVLSTFYTFSRSDLFTVSDFSCSVYFRSVPSTWDRCNL